MNQQYAHLAGLMLGHALGAEVLLAPAVCRSSFGVIAGVLNITLPYSRGPGSRNIPGLRPRQHHLPDITLQTYPSGQLRRDQVPNHPSAHMAPAAVTGGAT